MGSRRSEELRDQYEEAALALLMDEYAEAKGAELLAEYEEEVAAGNLPEMPPELDAKCVKIIEKKFARQRREERIIRFFNGAKRAAAAVMIVLGLGTTLVLSVEAIRTPVINFILEQHEKFTSITIGETQSTAPTDEDSTKPVAPSSETDDLPLAGMLPDGYELVWFNVLDNGGYSWRYRNDEDEGIFLDLCPSVGLLNVDTEDADFSDMKLSGYDALFYEKNGYKLIWFDPDLGMTCQLRATGLDQDAFWQLAVQISANMA